MKAAERRVLVGIAIAVAVALRLAFVATTEVIGMSESPVEAVRAKSDSSIAVLARMCGRRAEKPLDASTSPRPRSSPRMCSRKPG